MAVCRRRSAVSSRRLRRCAVKDFEPLLSKYTRLAKTAPGASRVGWLDELQQQAQFEAMLTLNFASGDSALDVGCGVGDLLPLLTAGGFNGSYTGVDLLPAFIAEAQTRFADYPNAQFIVGNAARLALSPHDFVFASGLFDYKIKDSRTHWETMVAELFGLARKALVWNGYSQEPAGRDDMWAVDAAHVAALCQRLSPFWQLRSDYAPGHYTAFLFKRDYWLTPALQTLIGHLFLNRVSPAALKTNPQSIAQRYDVTMQQLNLVTEG